MGDWSPFPLLMGILSRRAAGDASPASTATSTTEQKDSTTPSSPLDEDERQVLEALGEGERIGSYVVESLLARGGTAWVFRGRRLADDAPVALKILRPKLAARSEFLDVFQREAEALFELDHPNIVTVFGRGVARELHFLVMEYVDGSSLEHLLLAGVDLTKTQQLHLVREICAGVSYLHANGVVHGDLKPANVLVGSDGSVKLTDFALARWIWHSRPALQDVVLRCCTPAYAAPELLRECAEPSPSTDIYALGVTFYKLFTGQFPQRGETNGATTTGMPHDPAPATQNTLPLAEPLNSILERAMAPDPADRYPTVGHLRAALEFALMQNP